MAKRGPGFHGYIPRIAPKGQKKVAPGQSEARPGEKGRPPKHRPGGAKDSGAVAAPGPGPCPNLAPILGAVILGGGLRSPGCAVACRGLPSGAPPGRPMFRHLRVCATVCSVPSSTVGGADHYVAPRKWDVNPFFTLAVACVLMSKHCPMDCSGIALGCCGLGCGTIRSWRGNEGDGGKRR